MKVTVKVELDDGNVVSEPSEAHHDDPKYWSQAAYHAACKSLAAVVQMIEAKYGGTDRLGTRDDLSEN